MKQVNFYSMNSGKRHCVASKYAYLIDDLSIRSIHNYVAYLTELNKNIEIKQYNPGC